MSGMWFGRKFAARRQSYQLRVLAHDYRLRSVELTLSVTAGTWTSERNVEIESLCDALVDYPIGKVLGGHAPHVTPVVTGIEGDLQHAGDPSLTNEYFVFRLKRPLSMGERARLDSKIVGSLDGGELVPWWSWRSANPVDRLDIRVVFDDSTLPAGNIRFQVLDESRKSVSEESVSKQGAAREFRRTITNPVPAWTYQFRWD
jgi:hypothetical protein